MAFAEEKQPFVREVVWMNGGQVRQGIVPVHRNHNRIVEEGGIFEVPAVERERKQHAIPRAAR
jgi:hypothetical protein